MLKSKAIHMKSGRYISFTCFLDWYMSCLLYQYFATYAYLAHQGIGAIQLGLGDVW